MTNSFRCPTMVLNISHYVILSSEKAEFKHETIVVYPFQVYNYADYSRINRYDINNKGFYQHICFVPRLEDKILYCPDLLLSTIKTILTFS